MKRILIIEDEKTLCKVLKNFLQDRGYEVFTAFDGEEGMRLFSILSCDVVITDILMPTKEGLETILELKQQAPDVKIIAISGGGSGLGDELLDMAKDFGARYTLRKPLMLEELVELVEKVLNE